MPLSIGVGISPTLGAGVGGPDPNAAILDVFTGGKRGFALAPWNLNTLFQERSGAAAITPAGVGDQVGTIRSLVNGHYAVAVSDSKRMYLRQTVGGLYYLEPDAVDDCYRITGLTLGTTQYEWLAHEQVTAKPFMMEHGATTAADGHYFRGDRAYAWRMTRSSTLHAADAVSAWADGLHLNERSYVANVGGKFYKDGVEQGNGTLTGTARPEADVTLDMNIGSRNQTSIFLSGKLFGHVLVDGAPPAAGSILAVRQLLAQKSGVAL